VVVVVCVRRCKGVFAVSQLSRTCMAWIGRVPLLWVLRGEPAVGTGGGGWRGQRGGGGDGVCVCGGGGG
jgi:hypothetical protein